MGRGLVGSSPHMKETSMKRMNPDGLFPKRLSQSVRALGCLTGT